MSEPILDAPTYQHGFVTGRYLTAVADGPDPDRLMDFTPAKGQVTFTPETVIRRHEGPAPALVVQMSVTCHLDEQGYLTAPGGGRGVALIAGIYTVRFDVQGAQVPGPRRIEVKPTHTEVAPLDLVLAMPEVVPPGSVVVVDETTAQRAEAAAARAEAIVTDLEAEVRAVVLASPELKGEKGDDGDDGHTPALSWQGTALAVDGVPGPDLRGPAGEDGEDGAPGPAPSIKIGTVSSGTTPSATITGTSPDLTLGLVLPKGDRGDRGETGAPGVVSSASSYVIVGPGRPDVPSTTAGTITGSEPVGAEYRSQDGAQVGAYVWMKRPGGKWEVVDGDTGARNVLGLKTSHWSTNLGAPWTVRRVGNMVLMSLPFTTPANTSKVSVFSDYGALAGFRPPAWTTFVFPAPSGTGTVKYAFSPTSHDAQATASTLFEAVMVWVTAEPWPSTLPGSPT